MEWVQTGQGSFSIRLQRGARDPDAAIIAARRNAPASGNAPETGAVIQMGAGKGISGQFGRSRAQLLPEALL